MTKALRIHVVTTTRADYGIYLPILRTLRATAGIDLRLLVSGTHLSPGFGSTWKLIEAEGFKIEEEIDVLVASDTPQAISKSMGLAVTGFAQSYARSRPDLLMVLGDRFEMAAATLAAVPFGFPIAHIHGGEVTAGAIDESFRHAITKMSHIHFATTQSHADRIVQLGEEPWRVHVCGAPSLDNLETLMLLDRDEVTARFGLVVPESFLLVTYHPTTVAWQDTPRQIDSVMGALHDIGRPVVFTMPNADTGNSVIRERIAAFLADHPDAHAVESLGTQGYFSLMSLAIAMVGNSSSGIIEAPAFELPVVNIGLRQAGRVRAANVIDVSDDRGAIVDAVKRAADPAFRASLVGLKNPYGEGRAAAVITEIIQKTDFKDARTILKRFHDVEVGS